MPGHAPYLMPDGQLLSKYLTLETEEKKSKKKGHKHSRNGKLRGKDQVWEHFKRQQATPSKSDTHEFDVVERMGNRRRTRWLNDKMLYDMNGPMTMDQIEAQFCPPPWGDEPSQQEPFRLLLEQHPNLWELLRNIDIETEQEWIQHMETRQPKNHSNPNAKAAMDAWQSIPRHLRRFLKTTHPVVTLEIELRLIDFKNSPRSASSNNFCKIIGQSRYTTLIYEGLCHFHRFAFSSTAQEDAEEEAVVYDIEINCRRDTPCNAAPGEALEVMCSDIIMATQEFQTEALSSKSLTKFVRTQIHGKEDRQ